MIDVLILAVALSMDAFAVAIGLGSKHQHKARFLAFTAGLYFGVFQGLMPLLGYFGGKNVLGWVEHFAHWIAFLLLLLIGAKMIYESFSEDIEKDIKKDTVKITHRMLLILAVATSIDAMAAGFALTLIETSPFLACVIIGLTTFIFSGLGVYIGVKSGTYLGSKAEFFGGVILILIGFKILLFT